MDAGQRTLNTVGVVEREVAAVQLDVTGLRRRQNLGDVLGPSVRFLTGNHDLGHVGLIHVAHRTLDQVVFVVN